jgi:succinate dehydrogenase / fumarate reductase, iron-sulfur subunit
MSETMTQVTYRIRRFDPDKDSAPHWESYTIPYTMGLTVLDGLWRVKELHAPDLSWRASCRMGVCGSCGMLVNGLPRLACNTQISELGATEIAVAPLPNFAIIKDLVPDVMPAIEAHQDLMPFIIREDVGERENPSGEFFQSAHELEQYLQFSYCIKCGCCMAACPTYATDPAYAGPMPLGQAHRYNADTRDGGFAERKKVLAGEKGPWRCHYAGECSRVCPKGVDPAKAIQLMKRELVMDYIGLHKKKCPAKVATPLKDVKRREGIPEPPKRTV